MLGICEAGGCGWRKLFAGSWPGCWMHKLLAVWGNYPLAVLLKRCWRRWEVRNGSAVAAVPSPPAQSDVAGCEDNEAEAAATAVGSVQCPLFVLRLQ